MTHEIVLTAIDRHFTRFICSEAGGDTSILAAVVPVLSSAMGRGDICLNLAEIAGHVLSMDGEGVAIPPLAELLRRLRTSPVVGAPGDYRPLILDLAGRLYLYRYWHYERELARVILAKGSAPAPLDDERLRLGLCRLFPGEGAETDWQKVAALAAARKRFCVISGGPGTGKTSTVVKILALLLEQGEERPLRVALAAPTGKSAARLKESLAALKEGLDCDPAVKVAIPAEVLTIHRLLGPIAGSIRFRHSPDNPLPFDTVIVDEASMVPLPLMAKLVLALREEARLILLGDRDQLASVEAGAVLGDLCGSGVPTFSAEFTRLSESAGVPLPGPVPQNLPALADSLVILRKNYRFGSDSGIAAAGRLVNAGDGAKALALLRDQAGSDACWRDVPRPEARKQELAAAIIEGYAPCLTAATPAEALERFDRFRILCALRQGPYGVVEINRVVEEVLAGQGLIDQRHRWYRGRPVLVTVNDYNLKLFNGDVGIVFPDPGGESAGVYFPAPDGGIRRVSPVRLPAHETVFAMTVHKSQGSEFRQVLLLLPNHDSEGLTRELIYTGITRAKERVEVWGEETVFRGGVNRRIERRSGLREALWGEI